MSDQTNISTEIPSPNYTPSQHKYSNSNHTEAAAKAMNGDLRSAHKTPDSHLETADSSLSDFEDLDAASSAASCTSYEAANFQKDQEIQRLLALLAAASLDRDNAVQQASRIQDESAEALDKLKSELRMSDNKRRLLVTAWKIMGPTEWVSSTAFDEVTTANQLLRAEIQAMRDAFEKETQLAMAEIQRCRGEMETEVAERFDVESELVDMREQLAMVEEHRYHIEKELLHSQAKHENEMSGMLQMHDLEMTAAREAHADELQKQRQENDQHTAELGTKLKNTAADLASVERERDKQVMENLNELEQSKQVVMELENQVSNGA